MQMGKQIIQSQNTFSATLALVFVWQTVLMHSLSKAFAGSGCRPTALFVSNQYVSLEVTHSTFFRESTSVCNLSWASSRPHLLFLWGLLCTQVCLFMMIHTEVESVFRTKAEQRGVLDRQQHWRRQGRHRVQSLWLLTSSQQGSYQGQRSMEEDRLDWVDME